MTGLVPSVTSQERRLSFNSLELIQGGTQATPRVKTARIPWKSLALARPHPTGLGKSRILQSLGHAACILGYRVRYATSAKLLREFTAALADGTFEHTLDSYARYDLLLIDEFGFDRLEREIPSQASTFYYRLLDARTGQRSTALATNIDFGAWADYLGDPPLAAAFLDRLVDGAVILKLTGESYTLRGH